MPTAHRFLHKSVKCNCKYCEVSAISGWYTASESLVAAQCLCVRRVSVQWEKADDTAIMWNHFHPLQWLTRTSPNRIYISSKCISVIHSRLSRLFVSSSGSFSGWQQYSYVLFYQRWHRAGGSASPFSIRLAELSFCHLQGVQKCRTLRAVFSLFIEWLSPFLMKEVFFFS